MSLRSALLALLRVGPLSGYDLQKQFSQSVGHVWHAPDSQIYPALRKMAVEGLVVAEEQTRGERGMRRVYHVTEAGDKAFLEWMNSPPEYQRTRDAAHLRAAYLESAEPAAARAFLRAHIDHWRHELKCWEGEIAHIDAMDNPTLVRRLNVTSEDDRERTIAYKRFAYQGLAARARAEIEWAEHGLEVIDRLEGPE
ncbi:PadR family transcriptional regulator [Brevibacterium sanguinis]|uniref:PadR family transcriptional regulator n=2 Tax=Brevibacterium TaxID=1696 RepID=A0A366IM19_9MICO|nr:MULTISPECIES: PadR family transcriptional regulator [Brevibacterium]RBP65609.1 PadR family transcriptional regulator [Brevibacterium sanguinis]RBP72243.1 PadR family transcriptional regulator [Brevibacterium celere]